MKVMVKHLQKLSAEELAGLSDAIDDELERRLSQTDGVSDSARRRAVQRSRSYRRETGASALPVMVTGLREKRRRRKVA